MVADEGDFLFAAYRLAGRAWKALLDRMGELVPFPEAVSPLVRGGFLSDLFVVVAARSDPDAALQGFFAVHGALAGRIERWWQDSRTALPDVDLSLDDFRRKVFIAVLHQFLRNTSCSTILGQPELPGFAAVVPGFKDQMEREDRYRNLFLTAALALGDRGAASFFERNHVSLLQEYVRIEFHRRALRGDAGSLAAIAHTEVFLRACTYAGGSLEGWLRGIAVNVVGVEARVRVRASLDDEARGPGEPEAPSVPLPEESGTLMEAALRHALGGLNENQRELLQDLFFERMTLEHAGAIRGIGAPATYERKRGILDSLRRSLLAYLLKKAGMGRGEAEEVLNEWAQDHRRAFAELFKTTFGSTAPRNDPPDQTEEIPPPAIGFWDRCAVPWI